MWRCPPAARRSSSSTPSRSPRHASNAREAWGAMLAAWAVVAGKTDDLRSRIEARRAQPMAELPAAVLSVQIEQAAGKTPAAAAGTRALGPSG